MRSDGQVQKSPTAWGLVVEIFELNGACYASVLLLLALDGLSLVAASAFAAS